MIKVYTDGSCSGNPGAGGYAAIIKYSDDKDRKPMVAYGGAAYTTNNRMELMAVIAALEKLKDETDIIEVISDSQYIVLAINNLWIIKWAKENFKDRPNSDLWKRLLPFLDKLEIIWTWVKGHSGDAYNERCDQIAKKVCDKYKCMKEA